MIRIGTGSEPAQIGGSEPAQIGGSEPAQIGGSEPAHIGVSEPVWKGTRNRFVYPFGGTCVLDRIRYSVDQNYRIGSRSDPDPCLLGSICKPLYYISVYTK